MASYRRSQLSQRQFAAEAGISLSALRCWLQPAGPSAAEAAEPAPFIAIPNLLPPAPNQTFSYRLQLPGDLNLEIAPGFVPAEVRELCRILQNL